eukprot:349850-Chlamydomonas_euryale.AAC.6
MSHYTSATRRAMRASYCSKSCAQRRGGSTGHATHHQHLTACVCERTPARPNALRRYQNLPAGRARHGIGALPPGAPPGSAAPHRTNKTEDARTSGESAAAPCRSWLDEGAANSGAA